MTFELPSGLPKGPWVVDDCLTVHCGGITIAWPHGGGDRKTCIAIARAIASIPDMVEEIGRLETAWHDAEVGRDKVLEQYRRLRALNAELVEALGDLIEDAEKQMRNPSFHMPYSLPKARAILAKAQEAS